MKSAVRTDWKTVPMPERQSRVKARRVFSGAEMETIRRGVKPQEMEDKWFVFWEEDKLYFQRSWTGICVYAAAFREAAEGGMELYEFAVNREPEQYSETSEERDRELLDYVIDVVLLRRLRPFPSDGSAEEKLALMAWSWAGRAMLGEHPDEA